MNELKLHPWLRQVNWHDLCRKTVLSPFAQEVERSRHKHHRQSNETVMSNSFLEDFNPVCFREYFAHYNYRDNKELIRVLEREHEEKEN